MSDVYEGLKSGTRRDAYAEIVVDLDYAQHGGDNKSYRAESRGRYLEERFIELNSCDKEQEHTRDNAGEHRAGDADRICRIDKYREHLDMGRRILFGLPEPIMHAAIAPTIPAAAPNGELLPKASASGNIQPTAVSEPRASFFSFCKSYFPLFSKTSLRSSDIILYRSAFSRQIQKRGKLSL